MTSPASLLLRATTNALIARRNSVHLPDKPATAATKQRDAVRPAFSYSAASAGTRAVVLEAARREEQQ